MPRAIAIFFTSVDFDHCISDEMFLVLQRSLRKEARRLDMRLRFHDMNCDLPSYVTDAAERSDGAIGFVRWDDKAIAGAWRGLSRRIPSVAIMNATDDATVNFVGVDEEKGISLLVDHLLAEGHNTIGFAAFNASVVTRRRIAGYLAALRTHGIAVRPELVFGFDAAKNEFLPAHITARAGCTTPAACRACADTIADHFLMLSPRPAIICETDTLADHIISRAETQGISVPEDIAVAGFDNAKTVSHFGEVVDNKHHRMLTSVDQYLRAIASGAFSMVTGMIEGRLPRTNNRRLIPPRLVVRRSSLKRSLNDDRSKDKYFMEEAKSYVQAHFTAPHIAGEIAAYFGMNRAYFFQKFKTLFGVNFTDYINRQRCDRALELLTKSTRSLTRVYLDSGYSSYDNFLKFFKRQLGMTPLQYRKKHGV